MACFLAVFGCATAPPMVAVAEVPGADALVDARMWAYTVYGFYLGRDMKRSGSGEVVFKALTDNRKVKARLMAEYDATPRFRKEYPDFSLYDGRVNCKTKAVTMKSTRLDYAFHPLGRGGLEQARAISAAVCLVSDLSQ